MSREPATGIVRIASAGDAAFLVEFEQAISPAINAQAIALAEAITRRCGSVVRDAVVGYATLTVYFDPLVMDATWLERETRDIAASLAPRVEAAGAIVEVPVCYGGELGPDLGAVAQFGACSEEEVVTIHADAVYRVYMLGFVPGFAYMASVDDRIAAPRRATPRTVVPPGSVAIAGKQTGIYPIATPGGWNIVGRTPVKPFDANRQPPSAFRAGDSVRFKPISRREYEAFH